MIPRRTIAHAFASVLAVVLFLGCSGAQAPEPATPGPSAADVAPSGDPCARLTVQLCSELGERSEGCLSVRSVLVFMSPAACEVASGDREHITARITELRSDCAKVAERLCKDVGEDTATCRSARQDLPQVPPGHCGPLLANYSDVLQGLMKREAMNRPLDAEGRQAMLAGSPPSFGPDGAGVTVVEFSDFECPFCAQTVPTVDSIREKYADRVRFIFRQYPLPFHPHARLASQAVLAAHLQGKFWPYHDLLFQNQSALGRDSLLEYAKQTGLDVKRFEADLDGEAVNKQLSEDMAIGERVNVQGTPTMFINGRRVENPLDVAAVSALLDEQLAGTAPKP